MQPLDSMSVMWFVSSVDPLSPSVGMDTVLSRETEELPCPHLRLERSFTRRLPADSISYTLGVGGSVPRPRPGATVDAHKTRSFLIRTSAC